MYLPTLITLFFVSLIACVPHEIEARDDVSLCKAALIALKASAFCSSFVPIKDVTSTSTAPGQVASTQVTVCAAQAKRAVTTTSSASTRAVNAQAKPAGQTSSTTSATQSVTLVETAVTSAATIENGAVTLATLTSTISSASQATTSGSSSGSGTRSGGNSTVSNGSPNPNASYVSVAGAMETARVWLCGAGLLGLGAVVAAL